jgi:hypothetical protein
VQVQSLDNPEFIKQLKNAAGITWRTVDERKVFIDQAKRAESEFKSVYESASSLAFESPFFAPGVLAETAVANFDTGGTSYYDINSNDRNPRQIAIVPGSRNVAIAWAKSPTSNIAATRNMLGTLWIGASKAGGDVLPNIAMSSSLKGRGGFGGAGYLPKSGKLFLFSHHAQDPQGTWFAVEKVPGNFDWDDEFPATDKSPGDDVGQWPSASGGMVIDAQDYDNDANVAETLDVIHFFTNTASKGYYNYSRGVDSASTFIFPGTPENSALRADSGQHIVATVVASKKSPKVALLWTSENACNSVPANCSDVYFAQSTNGGDSWIPGGIGTSTNITNYTNGPNGDRVRAMGDLMGVYNQGDSLIIAFLQYVDYDPNSGGSSLETDIMVWSAASGVRKAVVGNFDMPSYINYNTDMNDPRRFSLNWPHLAVHDGTADTNRTGYVYLIWTQFGGNDPASYNDTADHGRLNGEIYVAVSSNSGKTWGAPQNVTKSHTPGCTQGNCSDVTMASCAELCDDTIHIMYMSDLYGGTRTGSNSLAEGTNNPLIYMKVPAYDPVANIAISLSPANFIQNPDSAVNLNDTVLVENIGNANLTVDSVEHNDSKTWLTITDPDTVGFTVLEGNPSQAISFRVNDSGLSDGVYFDTIKAYVSTGDTLIAGAVVILAVDNGDSYFLTQFATLDEGSIKLSISNVSNLANGIALAGLYRIIANDTTNNLYDATEFVAVISDSGDSVVGRHIFGDVFMLPLQPLYTKADTTLSADKVLSTLGGTVKIPRLDATATVIHYAYASCQYAASVPDLMGVAYPGPWFGLRIYEELFWRKGDPRGLYSVQRVIRSTNPTWWPATTAYNPSTDTVYIGKAMDWDVHTTKFISSEAENYARPVPGTGLMWVEGAESLLFAADSTLQPNGHFGYVAFLGTGANIDPFAMHIGSSDSLTTLPDNVLYRVAADPAVDSGDYNPGLDGKQYKFFGADTSEHDSLPTDVRAVMTNIRYKPSDPDTVYVVNVLGVVAPADSLPVASMAAGVSASKADNGCKALARIYNKIRRESGLDTIPDLMSKLRCSAPCAAKPGDANASNSYSLGDVIATVNYIFNKPGCTPTPLCWLNSLLCRGDWTGEGAVTLGDVIKAVNYIFNKPPLGTWFPLTSGACCTPYNAP